MSACCVAMSYIAQGERGEGEEEEEEEEDRRVNKGCCLLV